MVSLVVSWSRQCDSFAVGPPSSRVGRSAGVDSLVFLRAEGSASSSGSDAEDEAFAAEVDQMEQEEKERVVGNLVSNDEWQGLSMELSDLVRMAIVEDLKDKTRDFLGKDDYKMGDLSKEVDSRVKDGKRCLKEQTGIFSQQSKESCLMNRSCNNGIRF